MSRITIKRYDKILNCLQLFSKHQLRPSPRRPPVAEDERRRHRPVATYLRCRRYRLPDQMASFRRFKLRQRGEMDDDTDDLLLR